MNAKADDPVKAIRTLTNGGVDYSFEAIGLKIAFIVDPVGTRIELTEGLTGK